jgi:hypothetical protein
MAGPQRSHLDHATASVEGAETPVGLVIASFGVKVTVQDVHRQVESRNAYPGRKKRKG